MAARALPERFLVAFALAGEHRDLVRGVAEAVERTLGSGSVFFDEWFEHYLAGPDADLRLQQIYTKDGSALAVVCVSERSGDRPWTMAEHAAVRARIMRARSSVDPRDAPSILPIRIGDGEPKGLLFNAIVPDVRTRTAEETAELIVNRLRLIVPEPRPAPSARTDPATMSKVFISYRRDDAAGHAGRIADYLGHRLGPERIVMDVDTDLGDRTAERVDSVVRSCAIMLVIIGPSWLSARDNTWRRRLDDPDDVVRLEIAAALQADLRVVPVIVGGAQLPSSGEFPRDISELVTRQALRLRDENWGHDIALLSDLLDEIVGPRTGGLDESRSQLRSPAPVTAPPSPRPAERVSVRPDAFMSYATEDRAWALALVSKLEQSGRRCWIAPRDIPAGTASYAKAITRAIKGSRLMIVIVSAHSNASEDVLAEVTLAKNNTVLRLPVRIDSTPLDEALEYYFSQSQWFDAADLTQEEAVQRLNAGIATHLD